MIGRQRDVRSNAIVRAPPTRQAALISVGFIFVAFFRLIVLYEIVQWDGSTGRSMSALTSQNQLLHIFTSGEIHLATGLVFLSARLGGEFHVKGHHDPNRVLA
jgi:uncharacterized membrane protein